MATFFPPWLGQPTPVQTPAPTAAAEALLSGARFGAETAHTAQQLALQQEQIRQHWAQLAQQYDLAMRELALNAAQMQARQRMAEQELVQRQIEASVHAAIESARRELEATRLRNEVYKTYNDLSLRAAEIAAQQEAARARLGIMSQTANIAATRQKREDWELTRDLTWEQAFIQNYERLRASNPELAKDEYALRLEAQRLTNATLGLPSERTLRKIFAGIRPPTQSSKEPGGLERIAQEFLARAQQKEAGTQAGSGSSSKQTPQPQQPEPDTAPIISISDKPESAEEVEVDKLLELLNSM